MRKHQATQATDRRTIRERSLMSDRNLAGIGLSRSQLDKCAGQGSSDARFEARTFSGPEGARDYLLFVPSALPKRRRTLLIMLHGCGQNAEEFAVATGMNLQAEEHGLIVAYPEQTSSHHLKACWNWYRPADQRRGAGEPALIAGLVSELTQEFGIEPDRTFISGLSAGGAMAAVLGETYPELFAAVGVHSGVACGAAYDASSALISMRSESGWLHQRRSARRSEHPIRTIVFHGMADDVVRPTNADRLIAAAEAGAATDVSCRTGTSPGGRTYTVAVASPPKGPALTELWLIEGTGHAWSGGSPGGSLTDPTGPDASSEMVRFFLAT